MALKLKKIKKKKPIEEVKEADPLLKDVSLNSGKSRGRPREATPDNPEGTGERMRTSFWLDHSLIAKAKRRARMRGTSLNAWVSNAIYDALIREQQAEHLPQGGHALLVNPYTQQTENSWQRPALPQRPSKAERRMEKHGPGYTLPGDGEEGSAFASWEDVERYWDEVDKYLSKDQQPPIWVEIGKKLGMDMNTARAADVAIGEPEFQAYRRDKEAMTRGHI